jgi:hypothetical protein
MKEIKKAFGKEFDYVKHIISINKQVKYINIGFKGKETKVYTINLNLGEDSMVNKELFINEPIESEYCVMSKGMFYPFFRIEKGLIGKASNNRTIAIDNDGVITDIATCLKIEASNFKNFLDLKPKDFEIMEGIKNQCFKYWENPIYNGGVKND